METLKGKQIIERMTQLMNYGKTTPTKQEGRNWANLEYSIKAPNGKTYGILRDKTKFYIKETNVENPTIKDFEFMGGIINGSKKYYTHYSHALNHLNLMIAEMNQKNPKAKGINLFESSYKQAVEECEKQGFMEEKKEVYEKTVLKIPTEQPAPAPTKPTAPVQPKDSSDMELDLGDVADDDSLDLDNDSGNELNLDDKGDPIDGTEDVKQVQQLTGKLGQAIRELDAPNPDLTKYVINSVIAALNLQDLEDKDQKQILKKIKKKMTGEGEFKGKDTTDFDVGDTGDEGGDEDSWDLDLGNTADTTDQDALNLPKKEKPSELEECNVPYGAKKISQNVNNKNAPFNKKPTNITTESKIKKTIAKYFELTPAEKEAATTKFLTDSINKVMQLKEGKLKCKTVEQEIALTNVLDYDKGFVIKTMNENIVLDTPYKINLGGKEYKKLIMIESSGKVSGILKDVATKTARQYRMNNKNDYLNFIKLGQ